MSDEEDDERERFGMTGADWAYSMDPLAQRRRMTKKQAWAGVFASDESDDSGGEGGRRGFGGSRGRKRRGGGGASAAAPISFVSGGVKGSQQQRHPQQQSREDENAVEDAGGGGDITDESDEELISVRLIEEHQAGRRRQQDGPMPPQPPGQDAPRNQRQRAHAEQDFGQWERHTKGIGMKLLEQMGYKQGKGLGKDLAGIVTPVQAVKRKGKEAVGFYREEVAPEPRRGNEESPAELAAKAAAAAAAARYKRSQGSQQQQPPRYAVKTREEIVREAAKRAPAGVPFFETNPADARTKVIDMTGREQRVYDGYAAMARSSAVDDDSAAAATTASTVDAAGKRRFDCPALLHNLARLAEAAEAEIVRADRQQREDRDRLAGLRSETDRLRRGRRTGQLAELDSIVQLMDMYEAAGGGCGPPPLPEACALARRFLATAPAEYRPVAVAMVAPAARRALEGWQPLLEPGRGAACARSVREALVPSGAGDAADAVLREALVPQVRRALAQWSPRQAAEALALVHGLRGLAPGLEELVSTVVAPALQRELQLWDPTRDPQPVHEWLQPWASDLPLENMHEQVLQKLGQCFGQWHPSDLSARAVLAPWRGAVRPQLLAAFLQRHVLPKLIDCLSEMRVDPSDQSLTQWAWCKAWWDLLSPQQLSSLLERGFFPSFHRALSTWLAAPGADFGQVAAWYAGWKDQLPPDCLDLPGVQHQLGQALRMMDAALSGQDPSAAVAAGSPSSLGYRPAGPPTATTPQLLQQPATVVNYNHGLGSARDLLERRAAEHGLVFAPTGRRHLGKQVFSFGRLQVNIERGLVFQLCDGRWDPVSLTDLMDRALKAM